MTKCTSGWRRIGVGRRGGGACQGMGWGPEGRCGLLLRKIMGRGATVPRSNLLVWAEEWDSGRGA